MENKHFHKKPPLLSVPEPQELTFSGMRGAEKALPCVMLLQCADLLWSPVPHPLAAHHCSAPGQHQERIVLLQDKAFSTLNLLLLPGNNTFGPVCPVLHGH